MIKYLSGIGSGGAMAVSCDVKEEDVDNGVTTIPSGLWM